MPRQTHQQWMAQFGADKIIETLEPYISEERRQRIDSVIQHRLQSIHLAIESPADVNNALATARTAEALGICAIHIIRPESSAGSFHAITRGAYHWIDIVMHDQLSQFIHYCQQAKLRLIGASSHAKVPISAIDVQQPLCLLLGNEQRGLSNEALNACADSFCIPIYGMAESYNLSVAAAIALYTTTCQKRASLTNTTDLSWEQQKALRAQFYLTGISQRLIAPLLTRDHR